MTEYNLYSDDSDSDANAEYHSSTAGFTMKQETQTPIGNKYEKEQHYVNKNKNKKQKIPVDEFIVKDILNERYIRGEIEYLVLWYGDEEEQTWEPEKNLDDCIVLTKYSLAKIEMNFQDENIKKIANIICEGLNAVLDKVIPGITGHDLEKTWKKVISKYGLEKDSRIGYPVGIGYPPTWGELTTSFRNGDKNILIENMTFHCIPALWLKEYGIVISETFVVKKNGAERLTNYDQKLFDLEDFK